MGLNNKVIGILGGGQLGRMLIQSSINIDVPIHVLDPNPNCPSASIASKYVKGDFNNYDDVLAFGKTVDTVGIEIEHVNTKALFELEKMGKKVYPQPHIIELIKDKGTQKEFYKANQIPTANFINVNEKSNLKEFGFPVVAKTRTGGYDGKGVKVIHAENDFNHPFFDTPFLLEEMVPFTKELSVIVARNSKGDIKVYPIVEQEFNNEANLVELLFSPANISQSITDECKDIAIKIIQKLEMVGVLAVELFLTNTNEILVNEIAPRTHNSGHHTIEVSETSQFEQHLRCLLDVDLGDTNQNQTGVMINLIGDKNHKGNVHYIGLERAFNEKNVYPHIYGKQETKPFRKMGHVTITGNNMEETRKRAIIVKKYIKVIAK